MLKVIGLTKKFGNIEAVKNVTFSVQAGEIFALIGPNGSGKTTIIKNIAGLLNPGGGNIKVGGFDVVKEPVKSKSYIGYIPDEPFVWPSMTGEEFLHFSGTLYGISEQERKDQIPKLLSIFNLEGIEKDFFENYSRGNKQKFVILAALLHKPKLLLIDEPIVGLDPKSAEIAKNKFKEFAKAGGTILMATHTLPVAQEIADKIGILDKGQLIVSGTMGELRNKARLGQDDSLESLYSAFIHD